MSSVIAPDPSPALRDSSTLDATLTVETPEQVMLTYTLAGFGSRAIAALIDIAILATLMVGLGVLMGISAGTAFARHVTGGGEWAIAIVMLLEFTLFWGYFVVFEGLNDGQTPGKMLLKLRVVRDGGYSVTFATSAVRNLLRVLDMQPGFFYTVGAVSVLVNKSGKRLGDIVAGTFVVHEGRERYTHGLTTKSRERDLPITTGPTSITPRLRDDEYDLLERFMARRGQLEPERRRVLAVQVAQRLTAHLESHTATPSAALVALFERERAARATAVAGRSDTGTHREQHAIVALGVARWNEFAVTLAEIRRTGLRRLTPAEASNFVERYRQLTADLARLQTASRGRSLDALFFVSRLVAGGHAVLYRRRGLGTAVALRYLTVDMPREVRRSALPIALAATVFFAPAVAAYTAVVHSPNVAERFVSPVMIERAERGEARRQNHEGYVTIKENERPIAASFIITNNIQISYLAFALGLTAGIGTILILVTNGVQLGGGAGIFAAKHVASLLWAFVAPHGVLELSSICIAAGGGLLIASALVLPGTMTRRQALIVRGRRAVTLVAVATLFLAVAGTIEGLISPRVWPIEWKFAVSAATAVAMIGYLSLGRRDERPADVMNASAATAPPGL